MDCGCSRHIINNKSLFSNYMDKNGGHMTFNDNTKYKIHYIDIVGYITLVLKASIILKS